MKLKGKELLNKIAELTKLDAATLTAALSDDAEKEIDVPEMVVYKTDDFETYKKNLIDSSREGVIQVAIKNFAKDRGIELSEAKRNLTGLEGVLKTAIETELKVKPDEQIAKLRSEFDTKLTERDNTIAQRDNHIKQMDERFFTINTKTQSLRKIKSETKIAPEMIFDLFTLNEATPVKTESGIIGARSKQTGELIKDDRLNPVPFGDVFAQYTDKNFAIKGGAGDGAGGGSGTKNKDGVIVFTSHDKWAEHWGEKSGEAEAVKSLAASIKNPNFKY